MSVNNTFSVILIVLLAIGVGACRFFDFSNSRAISKSKAESMRKEIENSPCENSKRLSEVSNLFRRKGFKPIIGEYKKASNVLLEVEGTEDETIVIGAHYDKTTLGCGAIDNWAGVVMIAFLAEEIESRKSNKSFKFVAFGGEERDLLGSKAMARSISANSKSLPCAMVNLDSFGFDKAWGLESISDKPMLALASVVERERGGSFSIRNYKGASSDSRSFQNIGVPSITLSGIDDDWREYLHQDADKASNIDFEMIYDNYEFVREFVLRLDETDCSELKKR